MASDKTLGLPRLPILAMQLAKRVGLAIPMVRLAMNNMMSVERKRAAFAGYVPTRHDVFVTTFAKSGTNWMMQIAQQIAHRGAAEFEHIHDVVPWPDAPGRPIGNLADRTGIERSPTQLRVIKTHLETEYVPYDPAAKYLTVLRDPKEVVVSSYYFLGGLFGVLRHVSIDQWFELSTRSDGLLSRWADHTASFWDWRDRPNVLVFNYREVLEQPVESIERVAATLGVALTPAELEQVVRRSDFAYMKAHETQFAPPRLPFSSAEPVAMVRRGKSQGSGELLSRAQQEEIDRLCRSHLDRLDSSFPYSSAFGPADTEAEPPDGATRSSNPAPS